jgi:hypothetical protein
MEKIINIILVFIFVMTLTGCKNNYPELDSDAIGFKIESFIDEEDDEALYSTFTYNDRTYMSYGTHNRSIKESDLDKCIGYIIQDENASSIVDLSNKDIRVYTLTDDKDNNFLMVYYIKTNWMNPIIFYRAIDTKDETINIPEYIDSLDYNYWK